MYNGCPDAQCYLAGNAAAIASLHSLLQCTRVLGWNVVSEPILDITDTPISDNTISHHHLTNGNASVLHVIITLSFQFWIIVQWSLS